jgi:hypothetical protein
MSSRCEKRHEEAQYRRTVLGLPVPVGPWQDQQVVVFNPVTNRAPGSSIMCARSSSEKTYDTLISMTHSMGHLLLRPFG